MCVVTDLRAEIERLRASEGTLHAVARAWGLPPNRGSAHLSKLLRGLPVSDATVRRIARAAGLLPPPRKLVRRVMTPEQAAAWDRLSRAERDAALRVSKF